MKRLCALLVGVLPLLAAPAGPVAVVFPRTPPYYVVRYGLPDSIVEAERWVFAQPGSDRFMEIRSRCSVRRYQDQETRVEAVFFRPELVLAAATIRRSTLWTQADVEVLLSEYGARWHRLNADLWVSEEGVRAIHRAGVFHLLSPRIIGAMEVQGRK